MRARSLLLCAFFAILAVPFLLRPKRAGRIATQDTMVIITPHNEAIRFEFGRGFAAWYKAKTGRTVSVDWRVIGGTSEITRFLEGEYVASFQNYWTRELHRPWSNEVQSGFERSKAGAGSTAAAQEARATFLNSQVSCGIDLFFGGGTYDFIRQAQAGTLVDSGIFRLHPEWFREDAIPHDFAGEEYWDRQGLWIGTVLSSYGLLYNRDALKRLGITEVPAQWTDLDDPRLVGEIALADPTKSSSMAKVFENILQQQMQRRLNALSLDRPELTPSARERLAVEEGWLAGLRVVQLLGANARYFSDTSQKPPIDVAQGDSAVGLCIDFYGRQQSEAVARRAGSSRVEYISPSGGSIGSVDPIALLRGAPHREVALAFIEYVLSMEGQKLWDFRPGTEGGPERYALRRLSVRRDFYTRTEFKPFLSDPQDSPFTETDRLVYHPVWTARIFREMAFVIRVMTMDTHGELTSAWRTIIEKGRPPEALAVLQDLASVSYAETEGRVHQALNAKDRSEELNLARELEEHFRAQYRRAKAIAEASASVRN